MDESIVVIGDVHLADTPPGRRSEGYRDQILAKVDEALAHPSDIVVWIGDLFHHKAANRVSYSITQALADRMTDGRTHLIVPGNHDLADGTLESIDRQPLGLLAKLPQVHLLIGGYRTPHGANLYGIPGTGPVSDASAAAWDEWVAPLGRGPDHDLVFAHAPISTESKPWPTWDPADMPFEGILVYGHQHDQARMWDEGDLTVVATGAIARGSISEADTIPSYITLKPEGIAVHPIECALPKDQIYRWDELTGIKLHDERMSDFVAKLSDVRLEGFSPVGIIADLRVRKDISEGVRSRAITLMEEA